MQCPKCKTEIPEGKLYCPSCGYAIQIVPDYDADLQENLDSVGSDIAGNVNRIDVADSSRTEFDTDATTREMPLVKKEEAREIKRASEKHQGKNETLGTIVVAAVLMIAVVAAAVIVSRSLFNGSFIPVKAVDDAISDNTADADEEDRVFVPEDEMPEIEGLEPDTLSEDTVSGDGIDAAEEILGELIVSPDSGAYSMPENISAKIRLDYETPADGEGFTGIIYYTDDGSEPDESSKVFKEVLPMPVGKSSYAFRFLDGNGNLSDTMYREYNLSYAGCTPADAVNYCVATLIQDGALLDIEGHVPGSLGTYSYECSSMTRSGNKAYFLIPESYADPGGSKQKTGTIYALDAETLELFKAKKGAGGEYSFEVFY